MNYLAHIFLARHSDDAMLGAILGDFVTPAEGRRFTADIAREVALHRSIDAFTDQHAVVSGAKRLFRPETRRFAGILLDLFYDHALAISWERFSDVRLPEFIRRFYAVLERRESILPSTFQGPAQRMVEHDWLGSYDTLDGIARAAHGLSTRLSQQGDRLRDGVNDLRLNQVALHAGFDRFFPELQAFAEQRRHALIAREQLCEPEASSSLS